jgi:hypothetical protein
MSGKLGEGRVLHFLGRFCRLPETRLPSPMVATQTGAGQPAEDLR